MIVVLAVALIILGLIVMNFGLFLFYAFLPLAYGLIGFGAGLNMGRALTGNVVGQFGALELILGLGVGLLMAVSYRILEPIRRIVIGAVLGATLGGFLAYAFGLAPAVNLALTLVAAVIGAILMQGLFDLIVILFTAITGAGLVLDGGYALTRLASLDRSDVFNRSNWIALVAWILLAVFGISWQAANRRRWVRRALG